MFQKYSKQSLASYTVIMFTMITHFVFYNLPILWRQYTHNRDVANHKPPKYSEQYRGSCFARNELVAKYFLADIKEQMF
jgi:hypothetical protein